MYARGYVSASQGHPQNAGLFFERGKAESANGAPLIRRPDYGVIGFSGGFLGRIQATLAINPTGNMVLSFGGGFSAMAPIPTFSASYGWIDSIRDSDIGAAATSDQVDDFIGGAGYNVGGGIFGNFSKVQSGFFAHGREAGLMTNLGGQAAGNVAALSVNVQTGDVQLGPGLSSFLSDARRYLGTRFTP
jgi:hypothetical protein